MRADVLVAPVEDILADPRLFPVQLDFGRDCITFVETRRDRIARTPFLDGRTAFASGMALEVSLSDALAARWPANREPSRLIFHVAFCGSTLLATLLDRPGRCFAEREPNILVDLANAAGRESSDRLAGTLELTRHLLGRSWSPAEVSICKPSNWANNLIPQLTAFPQWISPLFLVTSRRECLYALFRGGRERIAYVTRATDHLIKKTGIGGHLWLRAFERTEDKIEVAARVAVVGLHLQLALFEDAMRRGGWGAGNLLTLTDIEESPLYACGVASRALELGIPSDELQASVSERVWRNAKSPDEAYSPEWRRAENRQVASTYGDVIERVLDWAALLGLHEDRDLISARGQQAVALRA